MLGCGSVGGQIVGEKRRDRTCGHVLPKRDCGPRAAIPFDLESAERPLAQGKGRPEPPNPLGED